MGILRHDFLRNHPRIITAQQFLLLLQSPDYGIPLLFQQYLINRRFANIACLRFKTLTISSILAL